MAVNFESTREALRELMTTLGLRVNQLENALGWLFVGGSERMSPPDRFKQANAKIHFADQFAGSLEMNLNRVKEAIVSAKESRDLFIRANPEVGLNSA